MLRERLLVPTTHHHQPLTSTCFLRGLRSLTILAFLAGFFSSRSLSPSPLEELAEALLSNLRGGTWRQRQLETPHPKKTKHEVGRTQQRQAGGKTCPPTPPASGNP